MNNNRTKPIKRSTISALVTLDLTVTRPAARVVMRVLTLTVLLGVFLPPPGFAISYPNVNKNTTDNNQDSFYTEIQLPQLRAYSADPDAAFNAQHCHEPNLSKPNLSWLDRTHAYLSESLCRQAVRIDQFFGEYPDDPGDANSFLRIRNAVTWEDGKTTDLSFKPRVRARLHLPQISKRFNLIFSDDLIDQDSISSNEESLTENTNEPTSYATALRWILRENETVDFDFDIGLRSRSGIKSFTRFRAQRRFDIDPQSSVDFTQRVFWLDWDGFGTRTEIEYERLLSPRRLIRWTNAFTFSEFSQGVDLLQRVTLFKTISSKRGISYSAGINGFTRPTPTVEQYGLAVRYRKNFYRSWLFYELEPEILWPLEEQYTLTTRLTARLEIQFGEKK